MLNWADSSSTAVSYSDFLFYWLHLWPLMLSSCPANPITQHTLNPLPISTSPSLFLCGFSSFSPCCWCLFLLPGMGSALTILLCLIQSQLKPQFQSLRWISVVVLPPSSLLCWRAGASGAGSRGSGRGRRCWAGTWGRWAQCWNGAWWVWRQNLPTHCIPQKNYETTGKYTVKQIITTHLAKS